MQSLLACDTNLLLLVISNVHNELFQSQTSKTLNERKSRSLLAFFYKLHLCIQQTGSLVASICVISMNRSSTINVTDWPVQMIEISSYVVINDCLTHRWYYN